MANPEHLEVFRQGVEVWNKWREDNPETRPDLRYARTDQLEYGGVNLFESDLRGADFNNKNLSNSNLRRADLANANLGGANLTNASLKRANCFLADLSDATLKSANLEGADFGEAKLTNADFCNATFGSTVFAKVNLGTVRGLDKASHRRQSYIDIHTIFLSGGQIPRVFLEGIGVPDQFIEYAAQIKEDEVEYHSVFVSYSSKDQAIAERLYADLQKHGVRCWFAPEDLKIGEKFRRKIDESIHYHDKLLLILSEHSVASDWVEFEVEAALDRETRVGGEVLFPIRIDDSVMHSGIGWAAHLRRTRHIGDFRRWELQGAYQEAFERLLRDLMRVEGEQ